MNVKFIHNVIFLFMVAITVNVAHEVMDHDNEVCEVCLHVQSTDDVLPEAGVNHSQLIITSNQQNLLWISGFINAQHQRIDFIRGPPVFS